MPSCRSTRQENLANAVEAASHLVLCAAVIALMVARRTCDRQTRRRNVVIAEAAWLIVLTAGPGAELDVLYAIGGAPSGILADPVLA